MSEIEFQGLLSLMSLPMLFLFVGLKMTLQKRPSGEFAPTVAKFASKSLGVKLLRVSSGLGLRSEVEAATAFSVRGRVHRQLVSLKVVFAVAAVRAFGFVTHVPLFSAFSQR